MSHHCKLFQQSNLDGYKFQQCPLFCILCHMSIHTWPCLDEEYDGLFTVGLLLLLALFISMHSSYCLLSVDEVQGQRIMRRQIWQSCIRFHSMHWLHWVSCSLALLVSTDVMLWVNCMQCSVARMSDFGRQTFPVLCLIYGWQVATWWANYLLWVSQLGKLSLPPLWGWY